MSIHPLHHLIRQACLGCASRWRNFYLRLLGVRIQGYCWLRAVEIPAGHRNIQLQNCSLDRGVVLLCARKSEQIQISIGSGTYVNRGTFIDAIESVTIGRDVAIGPGCYITDHDHGTDPGKTPLAQEMIAKPTRIEDSVWLGANVVVLKGVTIGKRSIVGAGSVVTRDLPMDVIAVGVPARVMRSRMADGST